MPELRKTQIQTQKISDTSHANGLAYSFPSMGLNVADNNDMSDFGMLSDNRNMETTGNRELAAMEMIQKAK